VFSKIAWLQTANFVVCHSIAVICGICLTVGVDNVVTVTVTIYKLNQYVSDQLLVLPFNLQNHLNGGLTFVFEVIAGRPKGV
jgi:hypothetical protein